MNSRITTTTLLVVVSLLASLFITVNFAQDINAESETAGEIIVYIDGDEQSIKYNSMRAALEYVNNTDNIALGKEVMLVCEANKPIVFGGNHITIQRSITIEGNNAYAVCSMDNQDAEVTFDIETYGSLLEDTAVIINSFHNATIWGERDSTHGTNHDFTLVMNDCNSGDPNKVKGFRVYLSGTKGNNNLTLNNCDFGKNSGNCTVYSNANGFLELNNCTFDTINEPININSKSSDVDMKVKVNGCSFDDCGQGTQGDSNWAAPIRIVNSGSNGGNTSVNVDSCAFNYSPDKFSANGDVLIGDGRLGKVSNPISLTIVNSNAIVQFQSPGYYGSDGNTDPSKIKEADVKDTQILELDDGDITIMDVESDPVPPVVDDDDELPFIPPQSGGDDGADTTTYVAVAAAAAVVAIIAVLAVGISKGKL